MGLSSDTLVTMDFFFSSSKRVTKSEGPSVKNPVAKVGNGFGAGSAMFLESEKEVLWLLWVGSKSRRCQCGHEQMDPDDN